MIQDKLIPLLRLKYGGQSVRFDLRPQPLAIIPAKHPSVGELQINDDGTEVTIYLGEITHGHFSPFEADLTQGEIDVQVWDQVMEFLDDLFADRFLLWKSRTGGSGGFQLIDSSLAPIKHRPDTDYFTWSGPVDLERRT